MWIIDRYLTRLYAKVLAVCLFTIIGLYIVIDGFGNLDSFLRYARGSGSLFQVVSRYYGIRSLVIFDQASGIVSVMAVMFTAALLRRSSEFTAIEAAGIAKRRLVRPLLVSAMVVAVLATLVRECVVPQFVGDLGRAAQDLAGQEERQLFPRYDNDTEILIGGRATVAAEQKIRDANFRPPAALTSFSRQIVAGSAVWREAEADHPAGYLVQGVKTPPDIARKTSVKLDGETVIYGPADSPWLKPDECFIASRVSFAQLEAGPALRDYSSTGELITGLRNPSLDYGADVRTVIHSRIVRPVLDLVLVMLGLPVVLSRQIRGVFATAGRCLAVVMLFLVVLYAFRGLGFQMLISPALAAWGPLLVLTPLAAGMSRPLWE